MRKDGIIARSGCFSLQETAREVRMRRTRKNSTILVTGATGHQGGAVARSLIAGGWKVRALVRDSRKEAARELKALGIELVHGDLDDPASLRRAVKEVYGVFSVQTWSEKGVDGEIRMGRNLADAAKAAGVKHFIYSSVGGADRGTGIPHFESKYAIEEHIRSLELPSTIFRPVYFMYNFNAPQMQTAILNGTLVTALRPDRMLQMLAPEDLGTFVRLAFDHPEVYLDKTFELAGDELTMPEAAEIFSRITGRTVQYVQQPIEQVRRFNKDAGRMYAWFNDNGYHADIPALRALHPGLLSLEAWLTRSQWAEAKAA